MGESLWKSISKCKKYPKLKGNIETEICIIGGGLTGCLTAMLLSEAGYPTVLLEKNELGQLASGNNTGKATIQHGPVYSQITNKYTLEHAKAYRDFNLRGQELIHRICFEDKLDIAERTSWLYGENEKEHVQLLEEEKICKKLGLPCISKGEIPLPIRVTSALALEGQYQINPLQVLYAAAEKATAKQCRIYQHTTVTDIQPGEQVVITTEAGNTISAKQVVIACKYPCYRRGGSLIPRLYPQRSYIVVGEVKTPFQQGMFINLGNPTLSITGYDHQNQHYILFGGRGASVGKNTINPYGELKKTAKDLMGIQDFQYQYAAQDLITHDHMPFVGKMMGNPNIYLASGYKKWGLTTSAAAAIAIKGLIAQGYYPEEKYFTTKRTGDLFTREFVKKNFTVATDFVSTKISDVQKQLPQKKGEGKIMKIQRKRCGVYRDEQNKLWAVEMTCSHLGCGMVFNETERSWDCPCHGSRYGYDGQVLEGPATQALKQIPLS